MLLSFNILASIVILTGLIGHIGYGWPIEILTVSITALMTTFVACMPIVLEGRVTPFNIVTGLIIGPLAGVLFWLTVVELVEITGLS